MNQPTNHKLEMDQFNKVYNYFLWKAAKYGQVPDYEQRASGDMVYCGQTHYFLLKYGNKGRWVALTYYTDHRNREYAWLRGVWKSFDMEQYLDEFGN